MELNTRFKLNNAKLRELNNNKKVSEIDELGGIQGIAEKLGTNLETGLIGDTQDWIAFFGPNKFDEPLSKNYFQLLFNALKEPILILLSVCAVVEIVLGVTLKDASTGWTDGAAILIAVILVSNVTAGTDYDKEKKFRALNSVKNDRKVKVRRNGKEDVISILDVVVGDLVILDTGDWVPADGIFVDGHALVVDESSLTGESDSIKKDKSRPFMLSGTQVNEGSGVMLVTAVGMNSEWGITYSKLIVPTEDTPLQESLNKLAKTIGYVGTVIAVLVFIVLSIRFIINEADNWEWEKAQKFLNFFTLAITIVVVAVPEGLPLAVTISLAYSMKAMLKDNNLVRHLAACETMGGATNICSDKTGTLTENRMTVTNVWIGDHYIPDHIKDQVPSKIGKDMIKKLCIGIAVNSTAFFKSPQTEGGKIEFIGSKTECALLVLSQKLGYNYSELRKSNKVIEVFPFSSEKKRMSTIIESENGARVEVKGASEIILGLSDFYLDANEHPLPLTPDKREEVKRTIEKMASEGLRTLCLGYRQLDDTFKEEYKKAPDEHLTLYCIVGIQDPLRAEVPEAIRQCKKAGITVRMVTGDNKLTATRIATECGILNEGQLVLEGTDFRKMSDNELDAILPELRVLARSSPSDKYRLVTRLKHLKEVVAVTGDGTNDGPALKAADVGFGMGIAGTEIAKEASDIIIMDDNFASIVKAVMWGRCVRQNIQKFLQFQLTVNMVALTMALVAAAADKGEPLRPIQFLWVNLIQDTLAALALATEKPSMGLLNQSPAGRKERLITPTMWRNMIAGSAYQLAILFMMIFAGDKIWNIKEPDIDKLEDPSIHYTMVFNTFVFLQLFNEINARRLDNHWNTFSGFFSNWLFLGIIGFCVVGQVMFVQFGGTALATEPLDVGQWFSCVGLGASILIVSVMIRVIIPAPEWKWLKYNHKITRKPLLKRDHRVKIEEGVTIQLTESAR